MSWSPDSRKIRLAKYIAYTVVLCTWVCWESNVDNHPKNVAWLHWKAVVNSKGKMSEAYWKQLCQPWAPPVPTAVTPGCCCCRLLWARSYMFSVHDPCKMFSKQVLGTRAFRLWALWNVLGTPSFRFKIGTHLGLRSMTYCVYTAQCVRSF